MTLGRVGRKASNEHGKLRELLREFFKRRTTRVVGVVVLVAVVVSVLFLLLNLYVAPTKPSDRQDLVLALAQILGGSALLSGLYFTWRTLQVNREGQITDRYTRAIDQLRKVADNNNKLFEIRLGGIYYALERIARESEEDHWPIMEILTAYVRHHAPWRQPDEFPTPDPDIQAIMTVLRRRTHSIGNGEPEPLDLQETFLGAVNLYRANLVGADFSGAILWGANPFKANLSDANLSDAFLLRADLFAANLSGAKLSRANLSGAVLRGADFSEADFIGRNVPTDLSGADLSGARRLTQTQLDEANGDKNIQLPSHLKPPAHWGVKSDEQPEGE